MALQVEKLYLSGTPSGTVYTVPANKLAKIHIQYFFLGFNSNDGETSGLSTSTDGFLSLGRLLLNQSDGVKGGHWYKRNSTSQLSMGNIDCLMGAGQTITYNGNGYVNCQLLIMLEDI